jgi:hypothetical protein
MSRARGKATGRDPVSAALDDIRRIIGADGEDGTEPGVRRQEGIGEPRDIPGGLNHIANPPVKHQAVPVPEPEWPYRQSMLAHGVPPDEHGRHDRDPRLTGGQRGAAPVTPAAPPPPAAVPVYIVEKTWRDRPQAVADTRRVTLPVAGGEPAMICGANPARSLVQLLNENSTHNARFGQLRELTYDGANGVITGGSRLPAGATGYTVFRSQDELYATSEDSTQVVISVILESEVG